MNRGEFLTRPAAWIAVGGWALSAVLYSIGSRWHRLDAAARIASTIGCIALFVHVALAFHFTHSWSQDLALGETARQTAEVFGVEWSGGLYINYAFMLAWMMDTGWWWWRGLKNYRQRSLVVSTAWRAILLFMFFNATVVFTEGRYRWLGLLLCLGVGLSWWFGGSRHKR